MVFATASSAGVIASIAAALEHVVVGRAYSTLLAMVAHRAGSLWRQAGSGSGLLLARQLFALVPRTAENSISRLISATDSAVLSICTGADAVHMRWPTELPAPVLAP
jgi:hypothetical protein